VPMLGKCSTYTKLHFQSTVFLNVENACHSMFASSSVLTCTISQSARNTAVISTLRRLRQEDLKF
jgi:hypothetical protein